MPLAASIAAEYVLAGNQDVVPSSIKSLSLSGLTETGVVLHNIS